MPSYRKLTISPPGLAGCNVKSIFCSRARTCLTMFLCLVGIYAWVRGSVSMQSKSKGMRHVCNVYLGTARATKLWKAAPGELREGHQCDRVGRNAFPSNLASGSPHIRKYLKAFQWRSFLWSINCRVTSCETQVPCPNVRKSPLHPHKRSMRRHIQRPESSWRRGANSVYII